jgi:hypothetical protein
MYDSLSSQAMSSYLRLALAKPIPFHIAAIVAAVVVLQAVLDSAQFLKFALLLITIFLLHRSAMVRFSQRTAQHARYNLRGNPPTAPIMLQKTAKQRTKDANAARIGRGWPIKRANKMSRGLHNRRNDCFRNSGLQALMHAPRFLNWVLSHNVALPNGTRRFGCQSPSETQRALTRRAMPSNYKPGHGATPLRDCPACVMKQLIEVYWGNRNMGHNGEPYYLDSGTREFQELVRIDTILKKFSPQAGKNGEQQDPEEFQTRFLQACLESVNYT